MKYLKHFFICAVALFSPILSLSQTCPISAVIYHINGVNKPSLKSVVKSTEVLNARIGLYSVKATGIKDVRYLYNDSSGIMLDVIYELASQKAVERNASVADVFVSFVVSASGYVSTVSESDLLDIRTRVAIAISSSLPSSARNLVLEFSNEVAQRSLKASTQAVLVPHSQGNMFANEVYDNLRLALPLNLFRGLAVVNVANPASWAPSALYLTAHQDLVINQLAKYQSYFGLTMPPMAPNFDASIYAYGKDLTGHGFTEVYLNPYLPYQGQFANSIVATLIKKIDTALNKTSTFWDSPSYYYVDGVKTPKPAYIPADSTSVQVCFPSAVGGL